MDDYTLKPLITSNGIAPSSLNDLCTTSSDHVTLSLNADLTNSDIYSGDPKEHCLDQMTIQIGILGTGTYAQALSKRITGVVGCDVVMGSRNPHQRHHSLIINDNEAKGHVRLVTLSECVTSCELIFVALHRDDFKACLENHAKSLEGKVIVDVSNRDKKNASMSNAEYLAMILPKSRVIKGFNTVSAFAMEDVRNSSHLNIVYVAGDDAAARSEVIALAQAMGFRVMQYSMLSASRWMEESVLELFPKWRIPIFLASGVFCLWFLYVVLIYWIKQQESPFGWEQLFLKVANKPLCMTAITVLALTYLPGQLASVLQVWHGTKNQRFPHVLDVWLKHRKQFGLVAFFLASVHAVASILMLSPTYYSSWFHQPIVILPTNITDLTSGSELVVNVSETWMTWKGESACALGILAYVFMAVIALTSINSVGGALNWSEWRIVHSNLNYGVLAISSCHVCVMGAPGWIERGFPDMLTSITFLSVLLPLTVLTIKASFSVPPLSGHLKRIRRGWERRSHER